MTQNQINFQEVQELKRHNRATEELGAKELTIKEDINNINREHYTRQDEAAFVSARANARNAESNAQQALVASRNADTNQYNAMTQRINAQTNQRNAEINAQNAVTNARNAAVNEQNASTNFLNYALNNDVQRLNADSNRMSAEAAQSNASTNFLNYSINERNADINRQNANTREAVGSSQIFLNYTTGGQRLASMAADVFDSLNTAQNAAAPTPEVPINWPVYNLLGE